MAFLYDNLTVENALVVSGSLTINGSPVTDSSVTSAAIATLSGNLITSGQTLLANDNLIVTSVFTLSGIVLSNQTLDTTAINTLSGNVFTSGQALQLSDTLLRTADATLSGNLFSSGQILLAAIAAVPSSLNTIAIATLSGAVIQSGQTLLAITNLLNTADQTLSGNLFVSGQTLQLSDNLLRTADITLSGNLIQSGQILQSQVNLNSTAIGTLSGNVIASGQIIIPIIRGGTGQITASGAIKALSPMTTKGDLEVFDGQQLQRMTAGNSGAVLVTNPNNSGGVQWNDIDMQSAVCINVTTTSTSFTDLTSGTVTTATGSYPRRYMIDFTGHVAASNNNNRVNLQLLIGGNVITASNRGWIATAANAQTVMSINHVALVHPGTIIKVQWSITANTATMINSSLTVYGI